MKKNPSQKSRYDSDKQRWRALIDRDALADGQFYYAVVTTGIYCHPSCPSRHPKEENVRYFESGEAAIAAGYRACKRCRVDESASKHLHEGMVMSACRAIENSEEILTLKDLAKSAGMSRFHFQRVFKSIVGLTPKQFEKACRENLVRKTLMSSESVTEAIFAAGYNSIGHFYENASELIGMQPSKRRKRGQGETIRFAVGECSLGSILVAATDKGICTIALADDPQQLVQAFQTEFAGANLVGGNSKFETLVANVVGLVEDPTQRCQLTLDVRGTAFQKKVWQALTSIRSGETATYGEIARKIGKPKSFRAVAQACGANRLAVAIPCHRVIKSDGTLSGYRWGVERKRALLNKEMAA